jgi:hypothetical protein
MNICYQLLDIFQKEGKLYYRFYLADLETRKRRFRNIEFTKIEKHIEKPNDSWSELINYGRNFSLKLTISGEEGFMKILEEEFLKKEERSLHKLKQ